MSIKTELSKCYTALHKQNEGKSNKILTRYIFCLFKIATSYVYTCVYNVSVYG